MNTVTSIKAVLESGTITATDIEEVKDRMVIKSLTLNNGVVVHLAPSTLGVVIHHLTKVDKDGKPNTSRNTPKNRAQAGSTTKATRRSKRKTSSSRKSST